MKLTVPFNSDPHLATLDIREALGVKNLPYTFKDRKENIMSEKGFVIREFLGE